MAKGKRVQNALSLDVSHSSSNVSQKQFNILDLAQKFLKTRIVRSKSRNLSRIAFHALPLYLSQKNVVFWGPRVEETIAFDLWPMIRKSTTDLFDHSINLNVDATRRVLGPQSGSFSAIDPRSF
jgi:hypothetical protein